MQLFKKSLAIFNQPNGYAQKHAYNAIQPFTQAPPLEQLEEEAPENVERIKGNDLFSHFTADIINENVTFTR